MKLGIFVNTLSVFLLTSLYASAQYSENDWKERDSWMNVSTIFQSAGIEKGDIVADIGCHEGYLSIRLAKRVGEDGKVFSVDVREDRLETLKKNAKKRNLKNIRTIVGDYDDPKLPEKSVDIVFVVDTYHEMDDYMTILDHIKKSLKPGGRVLILEKLKDRVRDKSRKEQTNAHTLSPKYVKKELEEAGFIVTKEIGNFGDWENNPQKKIWFLVAELNGA